MNRRLRLYASIFLVLPSLLLHPQSLFDTTGGIKPSESYKIRGYARAGLFLNELSDKTALSTGFSDLALKLSTEDGKSYKAYADLRIRYGMEFGSQVKDFSIYEAYVSWYKRWIEISAGQSDQILFH